MWDREHMMRKSTVYMPKPPKAKHTHSLSLSHTHTGAGHAPNTQEDAITRVARAVSRGRKVNCKPYGGAHTHTHTHTLPNRHGYKYSRTSIWKLQLHFKMSLR